MHRHLTHVDVFVSFLEETATKYIYKMTGQFKTRLQVTTVPLYCTWVNISENGKLAVGFDVDTAMVSRSTGQYEGVESWQHAGKQVSEGD